MKTRSNQNERLTVIPKNKFLVSEMNFGVITWEYLGKEMMW